jgi:hypothetical protein
MARYSHKPLEAEVFDIVRSRVGHPKNDGVVACGQASFRIDGIAALWVRVCSATLLNGIGIIDLEGIYGICAIVEEAIYIHGGSTPA